MKKLLWGMVLVFVFSSFVMAQSAGDYRSTTTASGNWSTVANWETYNGTSWVAATDYPGQNSGAGTVTIQAGASLSLGVTPAYSIGGLVIENGENTELDLSGNSLTITGDVTINGDIQSTFSSGGDLIIGGNLTINASAQFTGDYIDITLNGGGTQTIAGTETSPVTVGTLTISGTDTVDNNLNAPITIYNQFLLISGTFLAGSSTYSFINQTSSTYVFDKSGGTFTPEFSTIKVTGDASLAIRTNASINFYNLYHEPTSVASTLFINESAGTPITYTIENELQLNPYSKGISLLSSNVTLAYSTASLLYSTSEPITVGAEWPSTNGPDNVTISAGSVTLGSGRTVPGSLTLSGGDLTVSGDLIVGTLTINNANSDLSISSNNLTATTVNLSNGTLSVNALNINASGTFNYGAGTLTASSVSYGSGANLVYNASKTMGVEWIDDIPNVTVASGATVSEVSATGDGTRNISGNLTLNGSGTISFAAGNTDNLNIGGALSIGSGSFTVQGGNIVVGSTVSISSGTITTYGGGLTSGNALTNGGTINAAGGTGTITVSADSLINTGIITTGTGGMHIVGYVKNNGTFNINGNSTVSGNFINRFLRNVAVNRVTLTINGDLTSEANSTFTGGGTVSLQGNFTSASGVSIVADDGVFEMNGSSSANVSIDNMVIISTFRVNKSAGATVSVTTTDGSQLRFVTNGILHIQQGTLILTNTAQILDQNGSDISNDNLTLQIDADGRLNTGGTSITGFATYSFASGSIVRFTGSTVSEIIPAASYGGIEVNNTSGLGVTLNGDITINDNLSVLGTSILYLNGKVLTINSATFTVASGATVYTANADGTVAGTDITGFDSYTVNGTIVFNGASIDENFPDGINNQPCNIRVNKSEGKLVINTAITIGGAGKTLTLNNGLISFGGSGSLTLAAGTTVNGGGNGSYVDGTVSRVFDENIDGTNQRILPVGAGGFYRPVRLAFSGLTGALTITATQTESQLTGTITASGVNAFASGLSRYWSISASGNGSYTNYTVDLIYTGTSDAQSSLTVIKGTNGGTWDQVGGSIAFPGTGRIQATFTSTQGFSDFAIGRTALTVTWVGTTGNWSNGANWSTGSQPANGDNVVIDGSSANVTFDAGATGTSFGTLTVSGGATLTLTKNGSVSFSGITVDNSSTLVFNGTSINSYNADNTTYSGTVQYNAGIIYADSYNNLVLNNSSAISANGPVAATNLTKQNSGNATLTDVSATTVSITGGTLTVSGVGTFDNFSNASGTTLATNASGGVSITNTFTNNGSINLAGSGNTTVPNIVNEGTISFSNEGNVTIGVYSGSGSINSSSSSKTVTFSSSLSAGGDVSFASTMTVTINGDLTISNGTFTPAGTTYFSGSALSVTGGNISTSDGTLIFNSNSGQTLSGNVSLYNLTVNKPSGNITFTGSSTLTVYGTLTLTSGNIVTNSTNIVHLAAGSSVSGGSSASFIEGPVDVSGTGDRKFPIGKDGVYRPAELITLDGTDPRIRFELFNSNPQGTPGTGLVRISSVRYWSARLISGSLTSTYVRLHYGPDDGVQDPFDVKVAYSQTVNGTYLSLDGAGSGGTSNGFVTSSSTTNAIDADGVYFTLGSSTNDNSLPVEIASFNAIGDYGKVILQWATESEIDNQGFYVYRSEERNGNYTKLNNQMIPGHQTTNERHEYSYEDKTVEEGKTYYYKLVSLDIDGKVNEYGDIVSAEVKVTPKVFTLHQNYPNPFNPTTKFNFDVPRETEISLIVYNALGQEVKRILDRQLLSPGNYTNYQWDATNEQGIPVPGGIYFVRMIAHKFNYQKTMKMIYLK